jgi:hypothetical protein
MMNKKYVFLTTLGSLGTLGFTRGIHNYDYQYKQKIYKREPYLYSKKILFGFVGSCCYITPLFFFIILPKEIYRLEVNIRQLEEEKKTDYYNSIF